MKKWFSYYLRIVVLILVIPLIAMKFSEEVNWTLFDFLVGGIMMLIPAVIVGVAFMYVKNIKYRIALVILLFLLFLLSWVELAVGIFGTRFAGN